MIQVEEREGTGQLKRKGTKEATDVAGGKKTDPAILQPGVGVLKREGCHLSPRLSTAGWELTTATDCRLFSWEAQTHLSTSTPYTAALPAVYLLHESKLLSSARALAAHSLGNVAMALSWTLYFISANKSHFILYLGKAGWQQPPQNVL